MERIRGFGDYALYKSVFFLLTDLLAFLFLLIVHGSPVHACSCTELVPADLSRAGVPRRQPHRRSSLATLPSVGAVP